MKNFKEVSLPHNRQEEILQSAALVYFYKALATGSIQLSRSDYEDWEVTKMEKGINIDISVDGETFEFQLIDFPHGSTPVSH